MSYGESRGESSNTRTHYRLGLLEGKVGQMEKSIESIREDQRQIFHRLNINSQTLQEIKGSVDRLVILQENTQEKVKSLETEQGSLVVDVKKPWEKPVGELMFDIFLKAIYVVGVGIVVALIIIGVGAGK